MNLDLFFAAPPHIQIHAASALAALALGIWMLMAPKGTLPHRTFGWGFVGLMTVVAITALFIRDFNGGMLSFIHIFVPITLFGLTAGMIAVKRKKKDIRRHRKEMRILVFAALIIPGLIAFLPGRLMFEVAFGGWTGMG